MNAMATAGKRLQSGSTCHAWRSPDHKAKAILLQLDLSRELLSYPGVVILREGECTHGDLREVEDLAKDLPRLLVPFKHVPSVYWSLRLEAADRHLLASELTERPEFVG